MAFAKIYDAYAPALYGITLKIINDREIAEDVLQEAFVKIWKNAGKYDTKKGSFFTWMLNITRNTSIDKYRQRARLNDRTIQNDTSFVSNSKEGSEQMNINHIGIRDLLHGLPEEQQIIIDYLYFRGFTQQETSDELDIPLGTVKTRARMAIKTLRNIFSILFSWI